LEATAAEEAVFCGVAEGAAVAAPTGRIQTSRMIITATRDKNRLLECDSTSFLFMVLLLRDKVLDTNYIAFSSTAFLAAI
jgi:hypothetical protein